ncbi:MAG TPA: hydrogenase nickel incorporation protein HypB [Desulfurivibrionaceae bacterium]|nr:hydrogenase nickel incorporation protein HypB [Desulfurivibrionaceae bacterium]
MCDSCNCDHGSPVTITGPEPVLADHHHHHHHLPQTRTIRLEREVLAKNDAVAEANRRYLRDRLVLALNLVSSPGSGKTTILERTIVDLKGEMAIQVIEGDQQTRRDAERISASGAEVVQVNTGAGCHLDSSMVARALERLKPPPQTLLFIENVGNLVCPALFDLGEASKVVIISVTEGEDKPQKYPQMFQAASLCLINKVDLLPHVNFQVKTCRELAAQVNPSLEFLEVSATTGEGLPAWYDWLRRRRTELLA